MAINNPIVTSVAGKDGDVILDKNDVGLSNVDNTSDLNKPISTATQTALNSKYDASNPSGYQTSAQVTTTVNNAVTAHGSAVDPHPQYLTASEGNAAYAPISHTHNLSDLNQSGASFGNTIQWNGTNWVPAAGIAKYVTTSTKTSTSNIVFTAIPEFNVAMTAGKSYRINIYLKHAAQTAATTGLSIAVVGTGGLAGFVTGNATFPTTTTGATTRPITALGTAVTNTGVPTAVTSYLCVIEALFVCTTSGTFSLSFRSEVNGSGMQTYNGSVMFVSEI